MFGSGRRGDEWMRELGLDCGVCVLVAVVWGVGRGWISAS